MAKKSTKKAPPNEKGAMGKLQSDFDQFLSAKVKLNVDMSGQRQDIFVKLENQIKDGLLHSGVALDKVLLQGSALQRTSIRPQKEDDGYDADILVVMRPKNNTPGNLKYLDTLFAALNSKYGGRIHKGTRTLTIDYSDNLSIDLVPCVERDDGIYVCNNSGSFLKTGGNDFRNWIDEKDKSVSGSNLRKTIQLLKYLRDEKDNFVVKSAVITVLVGHLVNKSDKKKSFPDFPTSFKNLIWRLDRSLQAQKKTLGKGKVPKVRNPMCRSELFNRGWESRHFESFVNQIGNYNKTTQEAYRLGYVENDYKGSLIQWRKLFGSQFGNTS